MEHIKLANQTIQHPCFPPLTTVAPTDDLKSSIGLFTWVAWTQNCIAVQQLCCMLLAAPRYQYLCCISWSMPVSAECIIIRAFPPSPLLCVAGWPGHWHAGAVEHTADRHFWSVSGGQPAVPGPFHPHPVLHAVIQHRCRQRSPVQLRLCSGLYELVPQHCLGLHTGEGVPPCKCLSSSIVASSHTLVHQDPIWQIPA